MDFKIDTLARGINTDFEGNSPHHKGVMSEIYQRPNIPKKPYKTITTKRINLNYRPLSRLSLDQKVMPKPYQSHKFILFITDVVTDYLITVPIHQSRSEDI